MPKFRCTNSECVKHTELDYYPKVRFLWNATSEKLESSYDECPVCGAHREVFKEEKGFTNAWYKSENARNYNNKAVKKFDYDPKYNH